MMNYFKLYTVLLSLLLPVFSNAHHPRTNKAGKDGITDPVAKAYIGHSTAERVNTDTLIYAELEKAYPGSAILTMAIFEGDLLEYARASGDATATEIDFADLASKKHASKFWNHRVLHYRAPKVRNDASNGTITANNEYAVYNYTYNDDSMLLYITGVNDGTFGQSHYNQYLITDDEAAALELFKAAGKYRYSGHDDIWVFERGAWTKDSDMFRDVMKASWDDVILDADRKKAIKNDILKFFDSEKKYKDLSVPWKRGIIFYGPPGNGKTISLKAAMKTLSSRPSDQIPILYVKSFTSFVPPEYSIANMFNHARRQAPCLLVLEDLDSLITPQVRSFFLNQVDGLQNNNGILMIGSTNHVELLDPGIAKRPSRFDRKYLFDNPTLAERVQYCDYWRGKLEKSGQSLVEFPHVLSEAIANITDGFSFAYIQEAFVAALLQIAGNSEDEERIRSDEGDGLDQYVLWRVIKEEIAALRRNLEESGNEYGYVDGVEQDDVVGWWPEDGVYPDEVQMRSQRSEGRIFHDEAEHVLVGEPF